MPIKATIETPNGSHHIGTKGSYGGELSKEELYPVIVFDDVPRVGTARMQFSADRYVASSVNGEGDPTKVWTNWRIIPRQILDSSNGIGDKTRKLLCEAAEPVIMEWLTSDAYVVARRLAVANAVSRIIAESLYSRDSARQFLAEQRSELTPETAERFDEALAALEVYDLAMKAATS